MSSISLWKVAGIVRSKNAGPYRITLDVLFDDPRVFEAVKESGAISPKSIAEAYGIDESEITSFFEVDMARAIKITIKRPQPQGAMSDTDMYGCQQHVPLMELQVPKTVSNPK